MSSGHTLWPVLAMENGPFIEDKHPAGCEVARVVAHFLIKKWQTSGSGNLRFWGPNFDQFFGPFARRHSASAISVAGFSFSLQGCCTV